MRIFRRMHRCRIGWKKRGEPGLNVFVHLRVYQYECVCSKNGRVVNNLITRVFLPCYCYFYVTPWIVTGWLSDNVEWPPACLLPVCCVSVSGQRKAENGEGSTQQAACKRFIVREWFARARLCAWRAGSNWQPGFFFLLRYDLVSVEISLCIPSLLVTRRSRDSGFFNRFANLFEGKDTAWARHPTNGATMQRRAVPEFISRINEIGFFLSLSWTELNE